MSRVDFADWGDHPPTIDWHRLDALAIPEGMESAMHRSWSNRLRGAGSFATLFCTSVLISCAPETTSSHMGSSTGGMGADSASAPATPGNGSGGSSGSTASQSNPLGGTMASTPASAASIGGTTPTSMGSANTSNANPSGGHATGGVTTTGSSRGGNATGGSIPRATDNRSGANAGGAASGGSQARTTVAGGASLATGGNTNTGGTGPGAGGNTATGGAGLGTTSHHGKWRIIPVGDSITATTCYPNLTAQKLTASGHMDFQFVGTVLNNQSCNGAANVQTEGHSSMLITNMTGDFVTWANAAMADIALIHFATNDVWNNISPANILNAYALLVDALRAAVPNVVVFVAQIIPMAPSGCAECGTRVQTFNQQIPAWASSRSTASSPIYVVDLWTGMTMITDSADGVHPNLAGAGKMSDKMSAAIIAKNLF